MEHVFLVGRVVSVAASLWLALSPGNSFKQAPFDWELSECREQGAADQAQLHTCRWAFGASGTVVLLLLAVLLRRLCRSVPGRLLVSVATQTDDVETGSRHLAHRDSQLVGVRPQRGASRRRGVVE